MMSRIADAVYALLLRFFPVQQRSKYGAEMMDAFRSERGETARERGEWSAVRYVMAAYADVTAAGWQMRQREKSRMRRYEAGWLTGIGRDLKHAARGLTRSWTFTLVCLTSLTIGLAINAVMMVFMRGSMAPPAAVNAEGAVELLVTTRGLALDDAWSYADFLDVQRAQTGLDVSGYALGTRHLRGEPSVDATPVSTMYVSANYFTTLGITVPHGRGFLPEEDDVSGEPPIVLGHDFWQYELGGNAEVLGTLLDLNGMRHRVVGVAPDRYDGHHAGHEVDAWVPLWTHPLLAAGSAYRSDRGADMLQVIGRLREGTSMSEANAAIAGVMRSLAEAHPATNEQRGAGVVQYTWQGGGNSGALILTAVMSMAIMVLLVVCLNVTGMVLVRSATKQRELSLRLALGSTRMRLVRYLMTESALLAATGALLSAAACAGLLVYLEYRTGDAVPEGMMSVAIATCVSLSLLAMCVIGLSPALKFSRPELLSTMKDDSGAGGRRTTLIHRIATSVQTAMALPLLVINLMVVQAAGLMDDGNYGFERENLYVASMDLAVEGYDDGDVASLVQRVPDALAGAAGVHSAAVGDAVPLDYVRRMRQVFAKDGTEGLWVSATRIGEGYFETIGTPVLRGRSIEARDVPESEPVAVLTQSLARALFPAGDALGRRVRFGFDRASEMERTVVGIVADVAGAAHDTEPHGVFVSMRQQPTTRITVAVRTSSESDAVATSIEDALLRLDPRLTRPVFYTSSTLMESIRREMYVGSFFFGGIATLTLLLAAIGVYGVVAFAVTTRTREIGLRMALGASRRGVLLMVLKDGARLAIPGLLIGVVLAVIIARLLLTQWYEYLDSAPLDWVVLTAATAAALGVVLLASTVPARRAARVQPMTALRAD